MTKRTVTEPNYHCPVCGTPSDLVMGPTQAFCTNRDGCNVISFNPSLADGGLSNPNFFDLSDSSSEKK